VSAGAPSPTVADVLARLMAILTGDSSRAAVAEWAGGLMGAEPQAIADPALWQLLRLAASVDIRSNGGFLHSDADIRDWIEAAGGA
jgi:hypothetical protein